MGIFDLFFDRRCKICGRKALSGAVCNECDREIKENINVRKRHFKVGTHFVEGTYLFEYKNDKVLKLVFALKQNGNKDLFEYAAELYRMAAFSDVPSYACFVPRRKVNVREYGYDHVKEPIIILCKKFGDSFTYMPVLKRKGSSKNQKDLSSRERAENVKNAFKLTKNDIPENVVLLDDVVTTGNSAVSCAKQILDKRNDVNLRFAFLVSRNAFTDEGQLEYQL